MCKPIYCTKIASKLARTYTDRHGLKDLCKNLLKVDLNKQNQTSDWGNDVLTESLSCIFHFPPKDKAAIILIINILWSFK